MWAEDTAGGGRDVVQIHEGDQLSEFVIMKPYSIDELLSLDAAASDAVEQILNKFVSPQDVVCVDRKDEDEAESEDGDIQVQGTGDATKIIVSGEPRPFVYIRACAVYLLRKFLPQLGDCNSPDWQGNEAALIARGELIYALSHVLFTLSGANMDMYRTVRQDDIDTITEELQSTSSQG